MSDLETNNVNFYEDHYRLASGASLVDHIRKSVPDNTYLSESDIILLYEEISKRIQEIIDGYIEGNKLTPKTNNKKYSEYRKDLFTQEDYNEIIESTKPSILHVIGADRDIWKMYMTCKRKGHTITRNDEIEAIKSETGSLISTCTVCKTGIQIHTIKRKDGSIKNCVVVEI